MEIDERVQIIIDYLANNLQLRDREIQGIKMALSVIHETKPTDLHLIRDKLDKTNIASEDLAWSMFIIKQHLATIRKECRKLKDPIFTSLVRKGRPSTSAIESEIRMVSEQVSDYEDEITSIENILEYLKHIETCIDRLQWNLKDIIYNSAKI